MTDREKLLQQVSETRTAAQDALRRYREATEAASAAGISMVEMGGRDEDVEEHERVHDYGRWGRAEQTEDRERFRALLHRMDIESSLPDLEEPPGAYETFTEVVLRVRWSEIFSFADGVLDHIQHLDGDTVGYAIDAILEPRYEGDEVEVLSVVARAEYEEDTPVEVYRHERQMQYNDTNDVNDDSDEDGDGDART